MKKIFLILLVTSFGVYAQDGAELDSQIMVETTMIDSVTTKPKTLALGVKLGIPNIIGGNVEVIFPVLNNHLAPYADFSGFDIDPDEDTSVAMSYTEFGLNYYFGQTGTGAYLSAGLGNLTTDLTFSNIEVEDGIYDGIGTVEEKIATTNLKIGYKSSGRFYFRIELGYGIGNIPDQLEIQARSASLGETSTEYEEFPDIPGVSENGIVIGNIGFGISF